MPEQDILENDIEIQADIPQNVQVNEFRTGITIGEVTTLPAGSYATVENVGTDDNVILDFGIPKGDAGSMWGELNGNIEDQTDLYTLLSGLRTDVDLKAPLASPALTGTPTAPTAIDGTNTTQIATTAFVKNAITNLDNVLRSDVVSYVQNYVNAAVANVLKTMNWANSVSFSLNRNATYSFPSNGYLIVYYATSSGVIGDCTLSGKTAYLHTGVPISVSAGVILKNNSATAHTFIFIPQLA